MSVYRSIALAGLLLGTIFSTNFHVFARQVGGGAMSGPGRAGVRNGAPPTNLFPAQFRAVIYEVQLATNQLTSPDTATLIKEAGTIESLAKALSATGKARILYRIDQPVNIFADGLLIGTSEPLVTSTASSVSGGTAVSSQTVNQTSYVNIGAIIQLSALVPPAEMKRDLPDAKLSVRLSGLPTVNGPRTPPPLMERLAPLQFDRPELLVSGVASSTDGAGRPVAFVVRYEFGKLDANVETTKPPAFTGTNLPALFQAEVYEVQAAADQLAKLDAERLVRDAANSDSLLATLSKSGKAQVLYRANQGVNVASDRVQVGNASPIIVSTTDTMIARRNTMIGQRQGLLITFSAQPTSDSKTSAPLVTIATHTSSVAASDVDLSPGQKARLVRNLNWQHSESLEFGKPRVAVAIRPSSSALDAQPVAYVIRYLFNPPDTK